MHGCRCLGQTTRALCRCLHGVQRVLFARWPRADEVLLQFEQPAPQLEYLLRTECLLRPGPSWLFRIASDGLAYELRSRRVRPGERYILVSADGPVQTTEHLQPVELECKGLHGALICLTRGAYTAVGSQAWTPRSCPSKEGRGVARRARRGFLGRRRAWRMARLRETVSGHLCRSRTRRSHGVAGTGIASRATISPRERPYSWNYHSSTLACTPSESTLGAAPWGHPWSMGALDVVMRIREARPWSPGMVAHGPLSVQVDPPHLHSSSSGRGASEMSVGGPAGRHVKVHAFAARYGVRREHRHEAAPACPAPFNAATPGDVISRGTSRRPERRHAPTRQLESARSSSRARSWVRSTYAANASSRRSAGPFAATANAT